MKAIYDIEIKGIDGSRIDLHQYEGKKILIVNVASECGYTPQYAQMQELYERYQDSLVVIGVPCDDFGGQEPGSHEEILKFCKSKYRVTFPLTEKVGIIHHTHPLYQFLSQKSINGRPETDVKWNFHKFIIDEQGHLLAHFPSSISPLSDDIISLVATDHGG